MKKVLFFMVFVLFSINHNAQVVADHSVVDLYDDIPQNWIDSVKTKLVWVIGMSHGYGYFRGAELLAQYDPNYAAGIWHNTSPPDYTDKELRLGRKQSIREYIWTSQDGIDNLNESHVTSQNETNNPYDFICFGWSYQSTWENDLGGGIDPVHQVRWAGSTQNGPDGNRRWGLDSGDSVLTDNRVCMDTYLDAVNQYNQYYIDQSYDTKFFFTNGVVDFKEGTELGFQRELKNQHIRDYVRNNGADDMYFFDYADILVYNDRGELYEADWNDNGNIRPHQQIHPDNRMDYDESFNIISPGTDEVEDHIGEVGAVRLAKALWWLLARASGWDGSTGNTSNENNTILSRSHIFIYSDANFIRISNVDGIINGQVELYDLQGRKIMRESVNGNTCYLSTSSLTAGLYLVTISKDSYNYVKELVLVP